MPACHAGDRGFESRRLRHEYFLCKRDENTWVRRSISFDSATSQSRSVTKSIPSAPPSNDILYMQGENLTDSQQVSSVHLNIDEYRYFLFYAVVAQR